MSTLTKERQRIKKMSEAVRAARQGELADATPVEIRKLLKAHKQDECIGDDSGLLKAKVFKLYGLGEPPQKTWTKNSVVYMLDERGHDYESGEVSTKKIAVTTLERVRNVRETEGSSGRPAVSESSCSRLPTIRRNEGLSY